MNYHKIEKISIANGTGIRTVLWVSGCTHHCKGCHNPQTWDVASGKLFDEEAKKELFEALSNNWNSGLTLSGGDPLHPANRDLVTILAREVKEKFPEKTIWMYTGYTYEDVKDLEVMKYIDAVVDGKFIEDLKDISIKFRGSSNQRIIYLKEQYVESI